jgi:hypothetical protein
MDTMTMTNQDHHVMAIKKTDQDTDEQAAKELVERFGERAFAWAKERIETLQKQGDHRAPDHAYQLLSAVEDELGRR